MTTYPLPTNIPLSTLDSRYVWQSPWYSVRQDTIQWPDGSVGQYNVVEKRPSVFIVPMTTEGDIVLIQNYRHTLRKWCWEMPAGGIELGQTPLQAAQAELLQEVGGTSDDWHFLFAAPTMNGIGDNIGHYFVAKNVQLGETQHEATEVIRVYTVPLDEALAMARTGAMQDVLTIAGLLAAEPLLRASS